MKNILIIYPKLFHCYEKFSRKVSKILCNNVGELSIVFPDDPNGFIKKFSKENLSGVTLLNSVNWGINDITHGIIFDDGEEFSKKIDFLKINNIPLRVIKISITRVINIKKEAKYQSKKSTPTYEYIGRGSYWGNPYSMYENGDDRDEVIRKYKYDFDYEKFPNKEKKEVYKLAGKRLGCFCKPKSCHGDILADYLNSWDDGK